METIERLILAGISPRDAVEIIAWYRMNGDDYGLDRFIDEIEQYRLQTT